MDEIRSTPVEEDPAMSPETPEDVAVLYTWANVHGGKYRDFSASRREYRAQQRHRLVEAQRQAELDAARTLEEAAARELEAARIEEEAAQAEAETPERRADAEEARRNAEENVERERQAAQRHVETAEELKQALEQAQREMEDARLRAEEQAARYAEADKRWREREREHEFVPGAMEDPYYFAGPMEPTAFAPGKGVRSSVPQRVSSESRIAASYYRARDIHAAEIAESRTESRTASRGSESESHRIVPREMDSDASRRIADDAPRRNSDGDRPFWRTHSAEHPIETAEDTLERNRPDELERIEHPPAVRNAEPQNDGYYDRMPLLGEPRNSNSRSTQNSAPSDLHIPPRAQQPYPSPDSGPRAVAAPAAATMPIFQEDPAIAGHLLDSRRRRESATDLSTRTERRPRSSEHPSNPTEAEHAESARAPIEQGPTDERNEYLAGDELHRDGRDYQVVGREIYRTRDASPEWLLRNRPAEDAARERLRADAREVALAAQQRLDEQQRKLNEARAEIERSRAEEERRIAEEDRRIAEEKLRAEQYRRAEEDKLRAEGERRRVAEERRRVEEERVLAEAHRRAEDARRAEERRKLEDQRRDQERLRMEEGRSRKEQERLRAEDEKRVEEAAEQRRNVLRPSRDSQIVRAADGGVNLRPLSDRGPLLSNLPPMRERSQTPNLPPPTDRPSRDGIRSARSVSEADAIPSSDRRRNLREAASLLPTSISGETAVASARPGDFSIRSAAALPSVAKFSADPASTVTSQRTSGTTPADTLQQSRERVAARWFALKGLMNAGTEQGADLPPPTVRSADLPTPCLSIVALSGGVGKTSLVATIGRALSSVGEKVLLADTTTHGLLPYYFGARELRPDVVRTFSPPPGSADAPVYMVNYETDRLGGDELKQTAMVEEMMRHARGAGRILLDLNGSSAWLARLLTRYQSNILVPIAPDMNSVLSIQSVDRFFSGSIDSEGRPVKPYYVLNQFDASLPLHLDVREVLRQQLGNRLLPVLIRRSPAVSEALAEGMTVIDYAPDSPVTDDYKHLAEWVRKLAAPATTGLRSIRWSER